MECKAFYSGDGLFLRGFVLIETLWNVKFNVFTEKISCLVVLIETLWNVKLGGIEDSTINTLY